jgi:hypothetical protein
MNGETVHRAGQVLKMIKGEGGMVAYLGTNSAYEVLCCSAIISRSSFTTKSFQLFKFSISLFEYPESSSNLEL